MQIAGIRGYTGYLDRNLATIKRFLCCGFIVLFGLLNSSKQALAAQICYMCSYTYEDEGSTTMPNSYDCVATLQNASQIICDLYCLTEQVYDQTTETMQSVTRSCGYNKGTTCSTSKASSVADVITTCYWSCQNNTCNGNDVSTPPSSATRPRAVHVIGAISIPLSIIVGWDLLTWDDYL